MAKSKTRKSSKRRRKPVGTGYVPTEITVSDGVAWSFPKFTTHVVAEGGPATVSVDMTPEQMRRVMLALLGS